MPGNSVLEVVEKLNRKLKEDPSLMEGFDCSYQFKIGSQNWALDLTASAPHKIEAKELKDADCSIEMSEENFEKLAQGKLAVPMALLFGKIKLSGDKILATRLTKLFKG
jgi:putative sterol carrier protein